MCTFFCTLFWLLAFLLVYFNRARHTFHSQRGWLLCYLEFHKILPATVICSFGVNNCISTTSLSLSVCLTLSLSVSLKHPNQCKLFPLYTAPVAILFGTQSTNFFPKPLAHSFSLLPLLHPPFPLLWSYYDIFLRLFFD